MREKMTLVQFSTFSNNWLIVYITYEGSKGSVYMGGKFAKKRNEWVNFEHINSLLTFAIEKKILFVVWKSVRAAT